MLKFFANHIWLRLPGVWQKRISSLFARLFTWKTSRLLIVPYCSLMGLDADYLDLFEPESGKAHYESYSDFFRRKYKLSPEIEGRTVWPCEGYVCDQGSFAEIPTTRVKGHTMAPAQVFGADGIPGSYHFVNIFLHNHNYHRIHAPVSGFVKNISRISGDLNFLRPWFYERAEVSFPSFTNERVTVELQDEQARSWYLTLVGGFGVGTIALEPEFSVGRFLTVGEEFAHFRLGSTLCIASPYEIAPTGYLSQVSVGQKLPVRETAYVREPRINESFI